MQLLKSLHIFRMRFLISFVGFPDFGADLSGCLTPAHGKHMPSAAQVIPVQDLPWR
jgi:hypothetical protein